MNTPMTSQRTAIYPTRAQEFWAGLRATLPLVISGIPFGIIFGALATANGISPWTTFGLSLLVYAGSAQFIATNLLTAGAAIPVIILTTFFVNLRHALYAATLAPHLRHFSHKWLLPLGFTLTDETFVVVITRYNAEDGAPHKRWYHLGSAAVMYGSWQASTLLGIMAGSSISNPASWGLDFALPVTFIGMLVPLVKTRPVLASVVAAGIAAVLCNGLPNQLGLIVAAVAGIGVGLVAESLQPPQASVISEGAP